MIAPAGEILGMTVPHFLRGLRTAKKTGTVVFERNGDVKKVYLKEGEVIFASSNRDEDQLGEYLLRAGTITKAQYDAASEIIKRTNKKLGAILVELGFLSPHDLVSGVKLQVRDIIVSLFAWRDGNYRFDEGPLPPDDIIPLHMSTGNLVLEGARALDWQVVRKILPPLNTVLRPAPDPFTLFQSADLSHDQRTVLSLIDGRRTMEEICSLAGSGDYNTLKALYLFLALQVAVVGEIKTEEEMTSVREALSHAAAPGAEKAEETASPEQQAARMMIRKAAEELEGRDHYQALGVTDGASGAEIKKAYFKLAKRYHPDRHFDPELNDMKSTLESLFTRITEAYNALNDEAKRKAYDFSRIKTPRKVEFEEDHTDRTGTAANQFNKGLKEYKAGNFWGALEAFGWACRLDPINAKYFHYLGLALLEMPRRRHDAEESFKKALEMEPSRVDSRLALADLYRRGGLKSRALAMLREALQWDPDSAQIKEAMLAVESGGAGGEQGGEKESSGFLGKLFGNKK
ncbi:MAG: DUF4388 domain-containing protein [Nitrospirota bacterium]